MVGKARVTWLLGKVVPGRKESWILMNESLPSSLFFGFAYSKYAQNAKNYEANTGKKMNFEGQAGEEQSGKAEGQEQQQEAVKDTSETSK